MTTPNTTNTAHLNRAIVAAGKASDQVSKTVLGLETAIGKTSDALATAVDKAVQVAKASLVEMQTDILASVDTAQAQLQQTSYAVEDKLAELEAAKVALADIENQIKSTLREENAKLRIQVLEDAEKVLKTLLVRFNLESVPSGTVEKLQEQVETLKQELELISVQAEDKLSARVAEEVARQAELLALKHKADIAEKDAQLKAAQDIAKAQQEEINNLRASIAQNMKTVTDVATAVATASSRVDSRQPA